MFLDVIPEGANEAMSVMQQRSSNLELVNIVGQLHGMPMNDGTVFDAKSVLEDVLKSFDKIPEASFPVQQQEIPSGPGTGQAEAQPEPQVQDEVGNITPEQDMGSMQEVTQ